MSTSEMTILKTALINEVEGEEFYRLAASRATEAELVETLTQLADDEKEHQEWLKELIIQIQKNQVTGISELTGEEAKSPGIFKLKKIREVSRSGMVMSVLHIGIMMEKASMNYYLEAAEQTGLPATRHLFEMLADWENQHLNALEEAYEDLKEAWWDKQGFSPA